MISFAFFFLLLVHNFVILTAQTIGHIVSVALMILLKLCNIVCLLGNNRSRHFLHSLLKFTNSLFSPDPFIFDRLVSFLSDCLYHIVLKVVNSLPE